MSNQSERGLDKNPKYHLFLLLLGLEELGKAVTPEPEMQPLPSSGCSFLQSGSSLNCSPSVSRMQAQAKVALLLIFPRAVLHPYGTYRCRYHNSSAVEIKYHCAVFQTRFEKYQDSKKVV